MGVVVLVNIPETVTPWFIFISTGLGTLAAVGGALLWAKRKLAHAFVDAVNEAVDPLKREVADVADVVKRELTADHGQSMRDHVAQTLAMAQQTAAELPRTAAALKDAAMIGDGPSSSSGLWPTPGARA